MILDRHEEYMYLKLVQDIISSGNLKNDRTGTRTSSKFGCQMRFNLRKTFPLLTTKRNYCGSSVVQLMPRSCERKACIYGMKIYQEII